jgi:hypothetical protein
MVYLSIVVSLSMPKEPLPPLIATSKERDFFRRDHFLTYSYFGYFDCKKATFLFLDILYGIFEYSNISSNA